MFVGRLSIRKFVQYLGTVLLFVVNAIHLPEIPFFRLAAVEYPRSAKAVSVVTPKWLIAATVGGPQNGADMVASIPAPSHTRLGGVPRAMSPQYANPGNAPILSSLLPTAISASGLVPSQFESIGSLPKSCTVYLEPSRAVYGHIDDG